MLPIRLKHLFAPGLLPPLGTPGSRSQSMRSFAPGSAGTPGSPTRSSTAFSCSRGSASDPKVEFSFAGAPVRFKMEHYRQILDRPFSTSHEASKADRSSSPRGTPGSRAQLKQCSWLRGNPWFSSRLMHSVAPGSSSTVEAFNCSRQAASTRESSSAERNGRGKYGQLIGQLPTMAKFYALKDRIIVIL